jgi:hypothetical protein
MSQLSDFQQTLRTHGAPISIALAGVLITTFIVGWFTQSTLLFDLSFLSDSVATRPWTLLSYPLAPIHGLIGTIFTVLWMWSVGGQVERDVHPTRYGVMLLAVTLLGSLFLWAGSLITGVSSYLQGFVLILPAVTIAWGTRYPTACVKLWCIIPIQARWVAWLSLLIVLFGVRPEMAAFAALPLILVYLFAANKLPIPYSGRVAASKKEVRSRNGWKFNDDFLADVHRREKDREERDRLRKLFESGMIDNTDERKAE